MSILDFNQLDNRQEVCSLAVIIICTCSARVMAMGPALQELSCPKCGRAYSKNTRKIMKEAYERNTTHRG